MEKSVTTKNMFWKFLPFFLFLTIFKFAAGLHYTLISPLGERLLPLWIVGLLMGGCSIIQLLLDVPAGHILDRYGYRLFLKVTTMIFIIAAVCFMFGLTKTTYLLSLFFSILGWLFFGPGINAYVLSHAPKEHAGSFISLRDVFCSVGIVLSSATLPLMLLLSPVYIGYFLAAIFFLALILIFLSPKDTVSVHKEIKIPTHHYYIRRHSIRDNIAVMKKLNPASSMLVMTHIAGAIFYATIWFVVPLIIAAQVHNGLLSIGLGMFDFAVVVLGFFLGKLADRTNKRTLIFFGLLLFSIGGLLIGFHFTWLFLVLGFLTTTGDEMSSIALWSWLENLDIDHAHDGLVSGVLGLFEDFGWAIGPIVAGVLYSIIGPSWTIAVAALPIVVSWMMYQFMARHNPVTVLLDNVSKKPHRRRHKQ